MKALLRPATVCALLAVLTLGGCGGDDDPDGQSGTSAGSEATTGVAAGKDVKSKKLPPDFPSEVPLVKGVVTDTVAQAGTWLVVLDVDAPYGKALRKAEDKMAASGFTEKSRTESAGSVMITFAGAGRTVTLSVIDKSSSTTVSYAVTKA